MHYSSLLLAAPLLSLFSTALAAPHNDIPKQKGRRDDHALNRERADAVKEAFTYAWDGYYKYAFPHDELRPVSNGFSDSR